MTIARPRTLSAALDALAERPHADILAGGTDFMVEVNFGHRRPTDIVALRRVEELRGWDAVDGVVELRAGVTYTQMEQELAEILPALAMAARTVGSPQIRNAGTVGGNLGTASPAGDTLPLLAALDAEVLLTGADGGRSLALGDFITGVKRTDRRPGELITGVRVRRPNGPQHFLKIGPRNAMVISVACLALAVDLDERRVRVGLGSVGPRPIRPQQAEDFIAAAIDWDAFSADPADVRRFGELVAGAAAPITDHRGTADYRRHTVGVLARRALERSLAA